MKIGCPGPRLSKKTGAIDFIEYFYKRRIPIFEIAAPLYKKGLSISDISLQTGIPRSSVYAALRKKRDILRPPKPVPFSRWRRGHGKTRARPPYGYCSFQGFIVEDPREYPTLLLIRSLWKSGMKITAIVRELDRREIPSRMGKRWSYGVIKSILKRGDQSK